METGELEVDMETTITESELASNLSEILDRVRVHGEQFSIERDGEPIALLGAARPKVGPTLQELVTLLAELPRPDEDFANDLEAIHAAQGIAEFPEWPN
ncbi:MAG: type II toxin-antitoxin system Phd/YefM family antitoxin [Dehalococcoidia bacterium]